MTEKTEKLHLKIGGISCSFCLETIKKAYQRQEGIKDVNVSLSHEEALITYNPKKITKGQIEKTLTDLGYTIRNPRKVKAIEEQKEELQRAKKYLILAAIITLISFSFMVLMWSGIRLEWFKLVMLFLALITMFGPGWHIKKKAWQALRRGILNQHNLLEFGAFSGLTGGLIGFFIPEFPSADFLAVAVFLTSYHILGEFSSLLVRTRASQAVQKLLDLQPKTALVIEKGREVVKEVSELKKDEVVRIKPGERIPIDGIIVKGFSSVDESIVTGESIPVEKNKGEEVVGGSINQFGALDIKVTKVGEETFLQQVAKQVEEARALKPSILIVVDRILKYYVPAVLIFALGSFIFWLGLGDVNRAVFASLAVLVMGYPCALGMAMPLALIRGGGRAAEEGILMRSGEAFQVFPQIKKIVLDKTGTITKGQPEVREFINYGNKEKVLSLIASAEMKSEHPLAQAILKYVNEQKVGYEEPESFKSFSGKGVKTGINNKEIIMGKPSFLEENEIKINKKQSHKIKELSQKGNTVVAMGVNKKLRGIMGLADPLKEDSQEAIAEMKERKIELIMITGDNERTAQAIAKKVEIEKFYSEVLPGKKAVKIRELERDEKIAMVGDGINDAPALMQADVGIALGTGADIAIDSSDVIITGQQLHKVITAKKIAEESYSKTKQNLGLAFLFNGLGVPAAATGLLHPVWAMVAMAASVSLILLNSFGLQIFGKGQEKVTFQQKTFQAFVPGMSCQGCRKTILTALQHSQGVFNPKVDLSSKKVSFTYTEKCDLKKIEKSLKEGYGEIYLLEG